MQSALARFPTRRRAVQGGSDLSFLLGCDLSLSGLSGSLSLELRLWHYVASFLTLQICRVRRQCAVVSLGFVFDLLSVLLPTVAAFSVFLPSRMACNSMERVLMGGMHRHHSVMHAGWNGFSMFFQCVLFSSFGHPCPGCCQPNDRQSSTGSVVVTVTCATTPLSQITVKTKRNR